MFSEFQAREYVINLIFSNQILSNVVLNKREAFHWTITEYIDKSIKKFIKQCICPIIFCTQWKKRLTKLWNVATYSYMGSGECKKGVSAKTRLSSYEIWCRKMYAPSSVNSMNDFWFCNGERLFRNGICWFCIKVCWFWFTLVCFVFQKVFQN